MNTLENLKKSFNANILAELIARCLIKDRFYLQRQSDKFKFISNLAENSDWLKFLQRISNSIERVEKNQASLPCNIAYDDNLPVAKRRAELFKLIKQHQVIIIAGETGSGKTTQLPKICLEAGRGVFGRIACTQPRRIAARSVAERISEELGSKLGEMVGYQVRFHDQVHQQSLIKVMTDGILLAEIQNDRFLTQYDTIIIDEAHERSINIDFLLGILKKLLLKRPDLKVIITSATIDTQRFAEHFGDATPVIEVSGRTFPVETRYRPLNKFEDDAGNVFEQDIPTGIIHALDELEKEDPFGDVLVFQIGERDIKETAEALKKHKFKNSDIVPLYARLSIVEQNKVFKTSQKRRIILSTNVAETSLTVPGIKFVIDPGLSRMSRYSVRSKVQRLPVEKISKASANQRKGRCGRVSNGICIRLYDEEDFNSRPDFTPPEIHRTSLASVILQMAQLRLGEVKSFPFIEPPEDRAINDGFRQLQEIGALNEKRQLTPSGRNLAKLPLEPRIAKMVIEGQKNGVLAEILVIASALSIQDPREVNESNRQQAKQAHKIFEDSRSDFLFFLNLWRFYEDKRRHLSQNKLRKLCKTNLLSYIRMKEWHDLYVQLESSLKGTGHKVPSLHLYEEVTENGLVAEKLSELHSLGVHRSLMAGLLGNIALRDEKNYLGARSTKLFIHPASALFKVKPKWLLSAELVETTKLYARNNAAIDVRWVESMAQHLIKHSYCDPHWQKKSGQVGAYESITLYGLPIVSRRRCNYGPINPKESRKIFIQDGLVRGDLNSRVAFFLHNKNLIQQIETIENKLRRPDYMVDDSALYDFYDAKIPTHIYSQPAFDKWAKKTAEKTLQECFLTEEFLLKQTIGDGVLHDFPDQFKLANSLPLKIDYQFEPGKTTDGLVFHIPLSALNLVKEADFEWLTPGFLKEKVVCYIKSLPKSLRKQFIPAPQYAELVLQEMSIDKVHEKGGFHNQLIWALNRRGQQRVSIADFEEVKLPTHLQPFYILEDEKGKFLAQETALGNLKEDYKHLLENKIHQHQAKRQPEKVINNWTFGDLPSQKIIKNQGAEMQVYPALQLKNNQIVLGLIADENQAKHLHGVAVLALLCRHLMDKEKYLQKKLPLQKACLCYAPYGTCKDLTQQVIERALKYLVPEPDKIKQQKQFEATLEKLRTHWINKAQDIAKQVSLILIAHQKIAKKIKGNLNPRWLASIADLRLQLDHLISKNFVQDTPEEWFKQLPRYLQAMEKRLEKIDVDPSKDQIFIRQIQPLLNQYEVLAKDATSISLPVNLPGLVKIRWLIEELRISLFAQPMKTLQPVSIKRLEKMLKEL